MPPRPSNVTRKSPPPHRPSNVTRECPPALLIVQGNVGDGGRSPRQLPSAPWPPARPAGPAAAAPPAESGGLALTRSAPIAAPPRRPLAPARPLVRQGRRRETRDGRRSAICISVRRRTWAQVRLKIKGLQIGGRDGCGGWGQPGRFECCGMLGTAAG